MPTSTRRAPGLLEQRRSADSVSERLRQRSADRENRWFTARTVTAMVAVVLVRREAKLVIDLINDVSISAVRLRTAFVEFRLGATGAIASSWVRIRPIVPSMTTFASAGRPRSRMCDHEDVRFASAQPARLHEA
jgi:hypothetical protein